MKPPRFLSLAESEMVVGAKYYDSQTKGLGRRFLQEVQHTVAAIGESPLAGPVIQGDIRRRLLPNFPFAILYIDAQEEIVIIAVMHLRRDPGYWANRL